MYIEDFSLKIKVASLSHCLIQIQKAIGYRKSSTLLLGRHSPYSGCVTLRVCNYPCIAEEFQYSTVATNIGRSGCRIILFYSYIFDSIIFIPCTIILRQRSSTLFPNCATVAACVMYPITECRIFKHRKSNLRMPVSFPNFVSK